MRDLYLATALMALASIASFAVAMSLGRRLSRRAATALCVILAAFILVHVLLASDRLWVTRVLPVPGVVILGNWLLPAVTALAGLAWRLIPSHVLRRGLLIVPLVALCVHHVLAPAFASAPAPLSDRWRDAVCLQTSPASCSAAAAATLLRAHGVHATEEEMARLCLTGERGTTNHGLYRGLKLKTAGTAWDVEAFATDAAGLRRTTGPAILNVRLAPGPGVDPRYETLWGWTPNVAHAVVYFRFVPDTDKVEMGDPSVGREDWSARDLHVLWHGEGLRLVPR